MYTSVYITNCIAGQKMKAKMESTGYANTKGGFFVGGTFTETWLSHQLGAQKKKVQGMGFFGMVAVIQIRVQISV